MDPASLWYFDGPPDTVEKAARSFDATSNRIMFVGHLHRWLIATPQTILPWMGNEPMRLMENERYLIVIAALCDGHFAIFDTTTLELTALDDRHETGVVV